MTVTPLDPRIRAVFDSMPGHVALLDQTGAIVVVNEAWRRFATANGLPPGFGLNRNYLDVCDRAVGLDSEVARDVAEGIRRVLSGQIPQFTTEYSCNAPDEPRWFTLVVTPVLEPGLSGAVVTHSDITERFNALRALHASEARLRLIFESAPECVKTLSLDGRLLEMNPAGLRLIEAESLANVTGRPIASLIHEDDRAGFWNLHTEACQGRTGRLQFRMVGLKGTERWLDMQAVPLPDDEGRVTAVLSVTRDIGAQREADKHAQLFQRLFDGSPDAQILVDERGHIVQANSAAGTMFLLPREALRNRPLEDLLPERYRGSHSGHLGTFFAAPRTRRMSAAQRLSARRPDGIEFPVDVMLSPMQADGVSLVLAVIRDTTAELEAARAIRDSDERFQLLAKATNDVMWDWDVATDSLWLDEAIEDLTGFRREETTATSAAWTARIHSQDRARLLASIRDAVKSNMTTWSDEFRIIRADGKEAYVLSRGYIVRNPSGRAVRMIGGMTDLTERRTVEQTLAQQAALLDAAQDAIYVRGLDHRITYWNVGAERLYGWNAGEAVGRSARELVCRDSQEFDAAMETLFLRGNWTGDLAQVDRHGRALLVDSRWTLVRDAGNEPLAVLVFNTDATDRRDVERQLLRAQRMDSLGTMAAGIAHDLNNVLAPILMSIELLRMNEQDDERMHILETIEASTRRGASMVKQVLSFARGVEGPRVPVSIDSLLRDVERVVNETFLKHIAVRVRVPADLRHVDGDATQLYQALLNLCLNARDAMPDGGTLSLSARNDLNQPPSVCIDVGDTGCGMRPEVADRIFEPFFTTKETGHGTGLGLSVTLGIVKSHGGTIDVASVPGRGTTFTICLPSLTRGDVHTGLTEDQDLPRGHGETVLVVDDEPAVRQMTVRTLEAFGYRTQVAAGGAEALQIYAAHQDELAAVITDLMMPSMNGHALIRSLVAINPQVRIVAVSGVNPGSRETGHINPAVKRVLTKPFTAYTLLSVLRQVLREPGSV